MKLLVLDVLICLAGRQLAVAGLNNTAFDRFAAALNIFEMRLQYFIFSCSTYRVMLVYFSSGTWSHLTVEDIEGECGIDAHLNV